MDEANRLAGVEFKRRRSGQFNFEGIVGQPATLQQFDGVDRIRAIRLRREVVFFQG